MVFVGALVHLRVCNSDAKMTAICARCAFNSCDMCEAVNGVGFDHSHPIFMRIVLMDEYVF